MWVFLCFGFAHGRLVNCFYPSIPVCGADIPVLLVDVTPRAASPAKASNGRDARGVNHPPLKKGTERC